MPLEDPSAAHFIPNCLYVPRTLGTVHGSFHLETHVPDVVSRLSHAGCSAGVSTPVGSVLHHPENLSLPIFPSVTFSLLVCFAAARGLAPQTMRDCTSPECCLWLSHPMWQDSDAEVQVFLHFLLVLVNPSWGISYFFQVLQADRRWVRPGGEEKI